MLWIARLRRRWVSLRRRGSSPREAVRPVLEFRADADGMLSHDSALLQLADLDTVDGVWTFDARDRMSQVSRRWLHMLGYVPEDVAQCGVDDFWRSLLHPDDRERVLIDEERQRLGDGQTLTKTYRMRHSDGGYRWLQSHSIVVERSPDGLPLRIVGSDRDVTDERERAERLDYLRTHDELTGLLNRRQFHAVVQWMIDSSRRDSSGFAMVRINLDRFGEINTQSGHAAGDALLCEVARALESHTRDSDVVARMGSDEFALVLGRVDVALALDRRLDNLRDALRSRHVTRLGEVRISASIGVASFPQDGDRLEDLLQRAELAMVEVKRAGGHAVGYFDNAMNEAACRKRRLLGDLAHAIDSGQGLALHYQPIMALASGACCKVEALLRWNHPELGAIGPADFIPLAEESGLIHDLGDFVMSQSQRDMDRLEREGVPLVQFSVNLSPLQIMARNRVNWTEKTLKDGVVRPPGRLCIEVTEGVLLARDSTVLDKLGGLRDLGIQIALDDFGTGYSSLSYLNTFQVDFLKIDRSFVSRIQGDERSLALCEAMVLMAHKIGIQVIAEGIETPGQLALLDDMGCDFGQGYLLGRPMPLAQLRDVLCERVLA